jgi:hypothetical protein
MEVKSTNDGLLTNVEVLASIKEQSENRSIMADNQASSDTLALSNIVLTKTKMNLLNRGSMEYEVINI